MIGSLVRSLFPAERRVTGDEAWAAWLGGSSAVTASSAMQLATVYSCVRVLAESVAMLPLVLYERTERNRTPATGNPLYDILQHLWNPEITSTEARMALMYWLALHGNGYAQIVRDNAGRVRELWPLAADRMRIERNQAGALLYRYTRPGDKDRTFQRTEILHVRGLSTDGLVGLSPIASAQNSFSRAQARSDYDQAFYQNGARPGGVLQHPGKLSDNAYNRLRKDWEARHQGPERAGKVAILEEGMAYSSIAIPQTDQQFLETQKFDANQIAAIFRVPSHMVNDLERATFANIAEKGQEFVDYTLAPWFRVWEDAIHRDLLTPAERQRMYAKHKAQALLRGNPTERSQFYTAGLQWGWASINDVRELEDMNPIEDGDTYFVPLNMVPLEMAVNGQMAATVDSTATAVDDADGTRGHAPGCTCGQHETRAVERRAEGDNETLRTSRVGMAGAMRPVLEDAAGRVTRREVRDVRRAVDKLLRNGSVVEFRAWLERFYVDDWAPVVVEAFRASMLSYARQAMLAAAAELGEKPKGLTDSLREFVGRYLDNMGGAWAASSRGQLEALLDEAAADGVEPATLIDTRLDGWAETRPAKTADRHSFEALNAFTIESYTTYNVTRVMWVASGESCPFCQSLNGRIVGISEYVVEGGSAVDAGDGSAPMLVRRPVRHGPLHGGCDCITIAVRG